MDSSASEPYAIPDMATRWNIIVPQGATLMISIAVDGAEDITAATDWRVRFLLPDQTTFVASIDNGYITAGSASNIKILTLPDTLTATWGAGNGRFDFEIEWPTATIRFVSGSLMQVVKQTGA